MSNAIGQDDQSGSVRDAARAIFVQKTTRRKCQRIWDRDRYLDRDGQFGSPPNASEMHQKQATKRAATTSSEAVSRAEAAVKSCGDGRSGGRHHHQPEKRDQSKKSGANRTKASGKTAGHCVTQAATLMTQRNQEVAAAEARAREYSRLRIGNMRDVCC